MLHYWLFFSSFDGNTNCTRVKLPLAWHLTILFFTLLHIHTHTWLDAHLCKTSTQLVCPLVSTCATLPTFMCALPHTLLYTFIHMRINFLMGKLFQFAWPFPKWQNIIIGWLISHVFLTACVIGNLHLADVHFTPLMTHSLLYLCAFLAHRRMHSLMHCLVHWLSFTIILWL